MKKLFRFVWKTALWAVVIVVALVLALPLWIGPVAKTVANSTVPGITGTEFKLGRFGLNFYTGSLDVGDVTLYNPDGFDPREAFSLGTFRVDMQVLSALSDTVVLNEVEIRDVFVSYVDDKDGVNNFDAIMKNVQKSQSGESGEPAADGDRAEAPGRPGKAPDRPAGGDGERSARKGKKVIIDRLVIDGVKVRWGVVPISLPVRIERTGIGRDSGGVDWEAVANEVVDAVMKQMNAIGQGLIDFGGALGEIGANGANRVLEAVKDVDVQGAAESVSGAASSSVKATGKAVGSITKGAGKAIGSMADGAGRALDATTDALKGAGGAIKELIGK